MESQERKRWKPFFQFQPLLNICPVCQMGRGRRSIINQSVKKKQGDIVALKKNQPSFARLSDKKITPNITLPCEFVKTLKKMDPELIARAVAPC